MIDLIARFMAETYNGGKWDDYTAEQKEVHRQRARDLSKLLFARWGVDSNGKTFIISDGKIVGRQG